MSVNQVMQRFRTLLRLIPKRYLSTYRNNPPKITKMGRYIYDNSANTISKIKYNGAVIVETKKGNDKIKAYNSGKNSIYAIYADAGKDTINIYGGDAVVDAGSGNDVINVSGGRTVVVSSGSGNDTLSIKGGTTVNIDAGSGNDAIYLRKGNGRIVMGGKGNDTIKISAGSEHVITAGVGNDKLYLEKGTKNSVIYTGDSGKDTITVSAGSYHILGGGAGNDKIYLNSGTGNELTVDAGSGNDEIIVKAGKEHTIHTGAGEDTISLSGGKMSTVYLEEGINKINTSAFTTCLVQKSKTSVDTITVDWKSNIGKTIIDTIKKEGVNTDQLIIKNAKSSDFTFKYGADENMLVVYAESDTSKAVAISGWFWNDAFSKITFTGDNVTLSYNQVFDKSIWV